MTQMNVAIEHIHFDTKNLQQNNFLYKHTEKCSKQIPVQDGAEKNSGTEKFHTYRYYMVMPEYIQLNYIAQFWVLLHLNC